MAAQRGGRYPQRHRIGGSKFPGSHADPLETRQIFGSVLRHLMGRRRSRVDLGFAGEYDDVAAQTVAIKIEGHGGVGFDVTQFEGVWLAVNEKGLAIPPDQTGLGCGVPLKLTVVSQIMRSSASRRATRFPNSVVRPIIGFSC